jgi:hypothetical protein
MEVALMAITHPILADISAGISVSDGGVMVGTSLSDGGDVLKKSNIFESDERYFII